MWPSTAGAGHVYNIYVRAEQDVENLCTGRKAMSQGLKPEVFSTILRPHQTGCGKSQAGMKRVPSAVKAVPILKPLHMG
jgi:hypothetical protein